jgi:hypothetical protein
MTRRLDHVREQSDVPADAIDGHLRRPAGLQVRLPARGLRVGETSVPPLQHLKISLTASEQNEPVLRQRRLRLFGQCARHTGRIAGPAARRDRYQ